jgi:hypothetical protein
MSCNFERVRDGAAPSNCMPYDSSADATDAISICMPYDSSADATDAPGLCMPYDSSADATGAPNTCMPYDSSADATGAPNTCMPYDSSADATDTRLLSFLMGANLAVSATQPSDDDLSDLFVIWQLVGGPRNYAPSGYVNLDRMYDTPPVRPP